MPVFSRLLLAWFFLVFSQQTARRWSSVGLPLAHRLRRWSNSEPTLGQRLVFCWVRKHLTCKVKEILPREVSFSEQCCHHSGWVVLPAGTISRTYDTAGQTGTSVTSLRALFVSTQTKVISLLVHLRTKMEH